MPKRSRIDDPNELAARIVGESTGNAELQRKSPPDKNPAAVALGRLGGLKGGRARAAKLSAKKRSSIARKAASARWAKKASE
jgi:hypothetical protein